MTATLDQLEFLKASISERIDSLNKRRLYYRHQAFFAFISTATLAALVTILLGIQVSARWSETIRICSLILTALITLINTYNAFFNHKTLWISNNNALNQFYELKFSIEYFEKASQPLDLEYITLFRNTYQKILNELNQTWHKSRTEAQK